MELDPLVLVGRLLIGGALLVSGIRLLKFLPMVSGLLGAKGVPYPRFIAAAGGAFENIVTRVDTEHFTDDEIVVEGRLSGRHVGEFQGFAPTGRDFVLPFVGFYRFDSAGKLVSERIVMNLGPLGHDPRWTPQ